MRVIFTGSRDWADPWMVDNVLKGLMARFGRFTVVHGDGRGLDHIVDSLARRYDLPIEPYTADWDRFGKRAGPLRNVLMVQSGADLCVAFKPDLNPTRSGGTEHTVTLCCDAGIEVMAFPEAATVKRTGKRWFSVRPEASLIELRDGSRAPAAPARTD